MRILRLIIIAACILFCLDVVSVQGSGVDRNVHQSPTLRNRDPLTEVISDLEEFIPRYMAEEEVLGVSIALIRDGRVAWSEGFGLADRLSKTPVNSVTTFQAASNSKVVTAYIALRLVDQGLLSLDEPLDSYVDEPYISQEEFRSSVTLRQTLSHTSGLGHDGISRKVRFQPGAGYSYSANGFLYTQKVLENITGKPLDQLAQEMVFDPLEMQNTSFVDSSSVLDEAASGHFSAMALFMAFSILLSVIFIVLWLISLLVHRIKNGIWRVSRKSTLLIYCVSIMLLMILVSVLHGGIKIYYLTLIGLTYGTLILLVWFADRILSNVMANRPWLRNIALIGVFFIAVVGLAGIASGIGDIPLPPVTNVKPSAAGTIRTSAEDLGKFLIELSDPKNLSPDLYTQMRSPHALLRSDISWGLGPGIQHSSDGDALWQWGQTLDFQSVMIIYPDLGYGVVVLTNSDLLSPDVAIDIAHRAIGGKIDAIRSGAHLEFNYQGPFID